MCLYHNHNHFLLCIYNIIRTTFNFVYIINRTFFIIIIVVYQLIRTIFIIVYIIIRNTFNVVYIIIRTIFCVFISFPFQTTDGAVKLTTCTLILQVNRPCLRRLGVRWKLGVFWQLLVVCWIESSRYSIYMREMWKPELRCPCLSFVEYLASFPWQTRTRNWIEDATKTRQIIDCASYRLTHF